MNQGAFYAMAMAVVTKMFEVMQTKGHDYTQGSDNKLANFEYEAIQNDCSPLDVIKIYQGKHRSALKTFYDTGQVQSEAPEMRLVDFLNYELLKFAEQMSIWGYVPREDWLKQAFIQAAGVQLAEVLAESEDTSAPSNTVEDFHDLAEDEFDAQADASLLDHGPSESPVGPVDFEDAKKATDATGPIPPRKSLIQFKKPKGHKTTDEPGVIKQRKNGLCCSDGPDCCE
jgi:hypothetical protein